MGGRHSARPGRLPAVYRRSRAFYDDWREKTIYADRDNHRGLHGGRRGSGILQGRVSNPSERRTGGRAPKAPRRDGVGEGAVPQPPPQIVFNFLYQMVSFLCIPCSLCFVFMKHPVQLATYVLNRGAPPIMLWPIIGRPIIGAK